MRALIWYCSALSWLFLYRSLYICSVILWYKKTKLTRSSNSNPRLQISGFFVLFFCFIFLYILYYYYFICRIDSVKISPPSPVLPSESNLPHVRFFSLVIFFVSTSRFFYMLNLTVLGQSFELLLHFSNFIRGMLSSLSMTIITLNPSRSFVSSHHQDCDTTRYTSKIGLLAVALFSTSSSRLLSP